MERTIPERKLLTDPSGSKPETHRPGPGAGRPPKRVWALQKVLGWGHVRQLDRVSRELLARDWQAGARPGDAPFTIDLDSTICETYGLAKEGARHHGYTGARGYHPLLAVAAGTGSLPAKLPYVKTAWTQWAWGTRPRNGH